MRLFEKLAEKFAHIFPSPFSLAIILTGICFVFCLLFTQIEASDYTQKAIFLADNWFRSAFNKDLLFFAFQMVLILLFGNVLAISKPIDSLLNKVIHFCNNTANSAAIVSFLTISLAMINWGLGLVFGAIFAKKIAQKALKENLPINYPIIATAGFSGMMVSHGGLSGSAPLKVAENGHFLADKIGVIPVSETTFSDMNIFVSFCVFIIIPLFFFFLGKHSNPLKIDELNNESEILSIQKKAVFGAEKIDYSSFFAKSFGLFVLLMAFKNIRFDNQNFLGFLTLNFLNLCFLGFSLLFHKNIAVFLQAVDNSISGTSGIITQFPLYFGILGIIESSGLINQISGFTAQFFNAETLPYYTFFSASMLNIFIPSGGGQWAIQGPIIVDSCTQLNADIYKNIMAFGYGDQLTNMIQPFWALPLLGITKIKASKILPYSFLLMLLGAIIFTLGLILF